jgi:hypothetical protein
LRLFASICRRNIGSIDTVGAYGDQNSAEEIVQTEESVLAFPSRVAFETAMISDTLKQCCAHPMRLAVSLIAYTGLYPQRHAPKLC